MLYAFKDNLILTSCHKGKIKLKFLTNNIFLLYSKYLYKGLETKQKQTRAIFNIVESYDNLFAIHLD
jgi:hypothetical protein